MKINKLTIWLIGSAQRDRIQKTFYKYQISLKLPNIAYQIQNIMSFWKVQFNRRGTAFHILSYHGVYTVWGVYPVISGFILWWKEALPGYDIPSCTVHLVERERNIIFVSKNIIIVWKNLHMLSFNFVYSQYISYSF